MAQCARSYICTYYHLVQQPNHSFLGAQAQQDVQQNDNIAQQQKLLFKEIECLSKHHCTLDFDRGFLSSLMTIKKEGIAIVTHFGLVETMVRTVSKQMNHHC